MNPDNEAQRIDEDILQSKAWILRLKGGAPPLGHPPKRPSAPESDRSEDTKPAEQQITPPVGAELSDTTILSMPSAETVKKAEARPPEEPDEIAEMTEATEISVPDESITGNEDIIPSAVFETEAVSESAKEADLPATPNEEPVQPEQAASEEYETASVSDELAGSTEERQPVESESEPEAIEQEIAQSSEPAFEQEGDSEIPEFDLAQQIMAEQRKTAENRRKGPGTGRIPIKEEEPKASTGPAKFAQTAAPMSPQQRIIAEIVSRDIGRYYTSKRRSRFGQV